MTHCNILRSLAVATVLTLLITPLAIFANETMSTPNYRLEPNASNSFGGFSESGRYQLVDSGGEAAIGSGSSGSYKLDSGYVAQLQQSIELNVLPDGLAAYYPLNTGTGIQAYDVSANNNRGVLEGSPQWSSGYVGEGGLEFSSGDYVDLGSDASLDITGDLTLSAWIYMTDMSEDKAILSWANGHSGDNYSFHLVILDDGTVRLNRSASQADSESGVISENQWHHVAVSHDTGEGEVKHFVDGVEVGSQSYSPTVNSSDGYASISRSDSQHFVGEIDEAKIFDRALDSDEILDSYVANEDGIANSLTLPKIGASQSQTVKADALVHTDAPGYDLGLSQDGNLSTSDGTEIPSISSSIDFPDPWNEGSTTGFGFTVTDAVQRDGKWGSDPDYEYAAIPDEVTTFHSRTGLSGGVEEVTELQFRLGVSGDQEAGIYNNRLGFTATLKP